MKSSVSDERIDGMLARARQIAEEDGEDFTEERIRGGLVTANPCGDTPFDQGWAMETGEYKVGTTREAYDAMMTERVVGRFRAMQPA